MAGMSRKPQLLILFSIFVFFLLIITTSYGSSLTDAVAKDDLLADPENEFTMFKEKFGKSYATQEEKDYRFSVFKDNLKRAMDNRVLDPTGSHGVTKYSDLTEEEFLSTFLGRVGHHRQGQGHHENLRHHNKASILPTDNVNADFYWMREDPNDNSPVNTKNLIVDVSDDEEQIKANLVKYGPLEVGFDARFMQTFKDGISCPTTCSNKPNHRALLIGYTTLKPYVPESEPDIPYLIINNEASPPRYDTGHPFWYICRYPAHNVCAIKSMVSTVPAALATTT